MNKSTKITTKYKDKDLELIFNENIILLERNTEVSFKIEDILKNWIINIKFVENDINNKYSNNTTYDGNTINYTLNYWNSDTFVEISTPHYITSKEDSFEAYVKIRTTGNERLDFRTLHLSIWKIKN